MRKKEEFFILCEIPANSVLLCVTEKSLIKFEL